MAVGLDDTSQGEAEAGGAARNEPGKLVSGFSEGGCHVVEISKFAIASGIDSGRRLPVSRCPMEVVNDSIENLG